MALIYLSLGSNLGNREENITKAIQTLDGKIGTLVKCSSLFETSPWGFESDHAFINAAAIFSTKLTPEEILLITENTEKDFGRLQKSINQNYNDRTLDIDLLLYNNFILDTEKLILPHPHMHERKFVLEPLAEIAPNVIHPIFKKNILQLLNELPSSSAI